MDSRKSASSSGKRPLLIEKSGPHSDHCRGVAAEPTHASLFHATVDHDCHGPFNDAAANGIALQLPLFIRSDPIVLRAEIGDGFLQRLDGCAPRLCLPLHKQSGRLLHLSTPEPLPQESHLLFEPTLALFLLSADLPAQL